MSPSFQLATGLKPSFESAVPLEGPVRIAIYRFWLRVDDIERDHREHKLAALLDTEVTKSLSLTLRFA